MHIFPVETARLRMRPMSVADGPLYAQLYTDEETMRFIGAPLSADRALASFRAALAGMQRSPIERLFLTVIEKASAREVGICSLQNFDPQRRSVQAGVMFVPTARALGYSKEAFAELIPRVFAELPVDRLWVQFAAEHVAVQRAVISVGFTRCREAGLEVGPRQHSVWSACRNSWVAPAAS
jgi:[ribosomal protein S5]-alanine N-acetyltransferase